MNNKVKFLRGTSGEYTVAEKDSDAIYFTTDDGKLYVGDKEVSGESITIDTVLSDTSENPVQNKVINAALNEKASKDTMTGATSSADGTSGLVPAPASGDEDKFLRGNGTWAIPEKLDSSSYTTVTIDTSDWTANPDGGYMFTYTLPTTMPYDNFNFDVVLSADQSAAKLQIEAWSCVIADGNITQTTSNSSTTAFTFYAFTTQPSVAITVGIQGVS